MRSSLVPTKRLHPVRHVVEKVVLRQLELGNGRDGAKLGQHGQSFGLHLIQPVVTLIVAEDDVEGAAAHPHHFGQHIPLPGAVVGDADGPAEMPHAELGQHLRQGQELFAGGDVAGQPASVLGAVFQVLVGGYTEGSGLHGVVENLLHLVQFIIGDRGALTGRDHAQHVAAQGREGDKAADVDAETLLVEAVHVFREGFPVPAHSLAHGLQRDGLDAVHHPHIEVPVFGAGGSEAEAALADGERRNTKPAGQRGIGVPVELGIVVGVQVYGARGHDAAAGVQFFYAATVDATANHRHPAVLDANVGADAGDASAVNDGAAAYYQVKLWHFIASIIEMLSGSHI